MTTPGKMDTLADRRLAPQSLRNRARSHVGERNPDPKRDYAVRGSAPCPAQARMRPPAPRLFRLPGVAADSSRSASGDKPNRLKEISGSSLRARRFRDLWPRALRTERGAEPRGRSESTVSRQRRGGA